MQANPTDPHYDWLYQVIKTCSEVEQQLSQYYAQLSEETEKCLRLYSQVRTVYERKLQRRR
jgi:hypothetical protein